MDEIYHDDSLGTHLNLVIVRLIMVGYYQVCPPLFLPGVEGPACRPQCLQNCDPEAMASLLVAVTWIFGGREQEKLTAPCP